MQTLMSFMAKRTTVSHLSGGGS